MENMKKTFEQLLEVDVRSSVAQDYKGLDYLSWANAIAYMLKEDPNATYQFCKAEDGLPFFSRGDVHFVRTEVTMFGETKEMVLPVMDNKHDAVKMPSSRQINDCLMRCLVKNIAMFGIGLRLYYKEGLEEFSLAEGQANQIASLMKAKGVDKESIREICHQLTGKRNVLDLTQTEAIKVIKHLTDLTPSKVEVKAEVKPTPAPTPEAPKPQGKPAEIKVQAPVPSEEVSDKLTKEQYQMIGHLYKTNQVTKEELAKYTLQINSQAKRPTDLTKDEADQLIEILKQH